MSAREMLELRTPLTKVMYFYEGQANAFPQKTSGNGLLRLCDGAG
eukprot:CAMPEP_0119304084 /NCGR_PEP_ID=MMETSP1333-20130426/5401_1 /TAXON_ID=418940 /ORGANISM="Scyphosphaera apsteinii, Strain RCC1455" /LENGTH=44 /DNA_ID= /DNA_START= /DNA_END= /DNA_ORIENTATION=